jgi:CheY-like chemotaxis protein
MVEALAQLLRRRGHEVCIACDGPAALAAVQTFRPEVVFLDIELPVLSGYEVARHLRQQPGLENVLLVATTGHAEEEVRSRADDAGFDAHLLKPFRVDHRAQISRPRPARWLRRPASLGGALRKSPVRWE